MEQNLANGSSKVFMIKIFYRPLRPGMFRWKKRKIKGKNYPASNRAINGHSLFQFSFRKSKSTQFEFNQEKKKEM